jgi:hypothetical protein
MAWGPSVDNSINRCPVANYPQILHAPYIDRSGACHRLPALLNGGLRITTHNSAILITYYQEEK